MTAAGAGTDRELMREAIVTLRCVLDIAVAEFDEPVLARRLVMRRVARSQLDVAARLVDYAAAQSRRPVPLRGMLDLGAAAADPPPVGSANRGAFDVTGGK